MAPRYARLGLRRGSLPHSFWTQHRLTVLAAVAIALAVLFMDTPVAFWTAATIAFGALCLHQLMGARRLHPRRPIGPDQPAEM